MQQRETGTALRVAARRREGRAHDANTARTPKGRSGVARPFKLAMLVGAFACIGFFVVLGVDVGADLVGSMRLGDTTISALFNQVVARVLDEDVPRVQSPSRSLARPRTTRAPRAVERAPSKVASPEGDARHVVPPRPDPEVERAKARLNELLGRL